MARKSKTQPRAHKWVSYHQWLRDHPGEDVPVDASETRWSQQQLFVAVEL